MNVIRIFIVEDQPTILRAELKLLGTCPGLSIVGAAMSGEEALSKIKSLEEAPHVILCDLGLPGMSGIEVTAALKAFNPCIEILVFTVFEEEEKVLQAVRAGAAGYLLKGALIEKILEAIREVHEGGTVIQPTLARKLLKHFSMPTEGTPSTLLNAVAKEKRPEYIAMLTVRELECLQILAKGLSNNEAASVLQLSRATIRTHIEHIYQKLDVSNRVEAVTEGIRQGIIEL